MIFPVVMYGCDSWIIKKAECQRIYAFKLWCWRRLLRVTGWQEDPTSPEISRSVVSDSLQPHESQHARPPCPSPTSGACLNSCPSRCHPTISFSVIPFSCPQSFPASGRVFSNEAALCVRWPKYWSFSFNISPSNEHLGLISFSMDWLDLFEVQGTLKSLLQHHSSKASILRHSAFFIVQLSHPYMNTGKIIALTRWTFICKVMPLHLGL